MQSSVALGSRAIKEGSRKLWIMIDFTNLLVVQGFSEAPQGYPTFMGKQDGSGGGSSHYQCPSQAKTLSAEPINLFFSVFYRFH